MRRLVVICAFLVALLVPAAVLAARSTPGDGTLVVQNGTAPKGQAVITLVISGSAIGRIQGLGKVIIDDANANSGSTPEVTGADGCKDLAADDPRQIYGNARLCTGTDFHFRAVGDTYAITVFGANVGLFAIGQGKAILSGSDGTYSLNGRDSLPIPATPTKPPLAIGLPIG